MKCSAIFWLWLERTVELELERVGVGGAESVEEGGSPFAPFCGLPFWRSCF